MKRVIALPGDTVEVRDERIYLNGQLLDEPYAIYRGSSRSLPEGYVDRDPITIADGEVFLVGDNRRRSSDSRWLGPTKTRDITGKALLIYMSVAPSVPRDPFGRPAPDETLPPEEPGAFRWSRFGQIIH